MSASPRTSDAPGTSATSLAPAAGVSPPPSDAMPGRFLSEVVVARGFVDKQNMDVAVHESRNGRKLAEILVARGLLTEDDLARSLGERYRLDHLDLDVFKVDPEARGLVDAEAARRHNAVPVAFLASGALVVAIDDPEGSTAVEAIEELTGLDVRPAVVSRSQLVTLLDGIEDAPAGAPAPRPEEPTPVADAEPAVAAFAAPAPLDLEPEAEPELQAEPELEAAPAPPPEVVFAVAEPVAHPDPTPAFDIPAAFAPAELGEAPATEAGADVRAAEAELRWVDAEGRAAQAEGRAAEAEARARQAEAAADELRRAASALEDRLGGAEGLAKAAETRAEGMALAARAANETLTRLVRAHETSTRAIEQHDNDLHALRAELEAERRERLRLEVGAAAPSTNGSGAKLAATHEQIAELERRHAEEVAALQTALARETEKRTAVLELMRDWLQPAESAEPTQVASAPAAFVLTAPEVSEPEPEVELVIPEPEPQSFFSEPEPEVELVIPEPEPQDFFSEPAPEQTPWPEVGEEPVAAAYEVPVAVLEELEPEPEPEPEPEVARVSVGPPGMVEPAPTAKVRGLRRMIDALRRS